MSSQERSDELALHGALDESALTPAERAELEATEVAAWATDIDHLRGSLRSAFEEVDEARDDSELVTNILAATTREDLSWRGELRLVGGFVRSRWKASMLLRIVAASLAAHVAAMPLLGYLGFFTPREPGFFTGIEAPAPPLDPEPVEELPDLEGPEIEEPELFDMEREDALALARFHLRDGGPEAELDDARDPVTRMLAQRSAYLNGGTPALDLPDAEGARVPAVLAVEHLLDRFVLEGVASYELTRRLGLLQGSEADEGPGALLVLGCLARAQAYGQLEGVEGAFTDWAVALAGSSRGPLAERLLSSSVLRPGSPLDEAWIEALRLEAGTLLEADPVGRAWGDWRPVGR